MISAALALVCAAGAWAQGGEDGWQPQHDSFAIAAGASGGAEGEWELRQEREGVAVYVRRIDGSKYKAFKGVAVLDASLPSLAAILDDTPACPKWLHRCEEGRMLEKVSESERIIYQVTDLPFPARSRDAVFHARVEYGANGSVLIVMECLPDYHPETKHIRIRHAYGTYLLEPLAEGGTRVTWTQRADPEGRLPAWIVNQLLTAMPRETLKALGEVAAQAPYKDASFLYDEAGQPYALAY